MLIEYSDEVLIIASLFLQVQYVIFIPGPLETTSSTLTAILTHRVS
jgi:hypothetical protein